ncbi:RIB43A-like with coiled-coils protein 2 [Oreochromis aureus]|uniref:RIB43A domain with coiled-coils 2 n=1 Tax=Oreochromis aureus TaxID=47969 RepID=A0A668TI44_OREAU|nr:RIB43A-like with coiled-coils protein 2 [Oreochromis aureus]
MRKTELLSMRLARASLEKRHNIETERKERIFNEKLRTIGVDKEALDEQVKEKREQVEAAKKEQNAYDADMLHYGKVACILDSRQMKEKRALEKAIVAYRQKYQQPEDGQEYDLNDPGRVKKIEQSDAQMMPPGLVGEDPESKVRLQNQKEQLREWLTQQQTEQAVERHQQQLEEQRYDQSRVEMDNRVVQLQSLEIERRKAAAIATKDFNRSMAEEKQRQDKQINSRQSQFQGTPSTEAVPGLSPSSDRRTPPESLQQIIQIQKYQIEEKRRKELEKKQEEEWHDRVRLNSARTTLLIERQQARMNRQLRRDLDSANAQLAETHKQQKPDIKRGRIDDSFFSKFNTCSR